MEDLGYEANHRAACRAAGESLAGRAVAFAEGNALGKGPQILRLGLDDVAWIRRRAAAGDPVFMQLEARASSATRHP